MTNDPKSDSLTPELLHALYCRLLQQSAALRYHWQRLWLEFIRAGFTEADLRLVLKYLLREFRAGRRNPGSLKLSNLLQIDRFEEDLLLARMQYGTPSQAVTPPKSSKKIPCLKPESPQDRSRNLDLLRACRIHLARRSDSRPESS